MKRRGASRLQAVEMRYLWNIKKGEKTIKSETRH
jgi:hypothetical protein